MQYNVCCSTPSTTSDLLIELQVGRQEPVMVLRVDDEKGYIDLSKRYASGSK